ncbi:hypothetical protein ACUWCL_29100, partial [Klebsiella pneumoniae]|uniref:hypothetical protein n=1 Tax=Klebsiella pneumoniae TaxID=573 RepID=UPI0040559794
MHQRIILTHTEIYVEKYHEDLKLLHNLIEDKINKEKEIRTDKLNENREEIPELTETTQYYKTHLKKSKDKFRP